MAELKAQTNAAPFPPHKDGNGKDCRCFLFRDHHKDAKGEECFCKIGMNHNTKPSPHKDKEGRSCSGPFHSVLNTPGKRVCHWCRREETYSSTEFILVFKKGITAVEATEFLLHFKFDGKALTVVSDKEKNLVEKNGIVAIAVAISRSSGKTVREWISEIGKSELVWFADQMMTVSFPETSFEPEMISQRATRKTPDDDPGFPDETNV